MAEFKSELEKITLTVELKFDPTPGFGPYRNVMPEEAIAHPAKMNTKLLEYLIRRFTKPGEIVLDPMAGSGSTGVVAALHGRNAVCVELEEKFYRWMEKARENVKKHPTLTPKGRIINILGDARRLSEILRKADIIVTSPPYSTALKGGGIAIKGHFNDPKLANRSYQPKTHGKNPKNIGNLPHGKIDTIVTSPPFGESNQHRGGTQNKERMMKGGRPAPYSKSKKNIGNLPLGSIDTVITSPPYERSETIHKHQGQTPEYFNKVGGIGHFSKEKIESEENIGTLKKETYLEAMLTVYSEMWKVLKPGGLAIIVIKPFIRNKKAVDLPYHTWVLLKKVGFKLVKLYKLRLKTMSFWRILYHKRFPDVPQIRHEWILVCKKIT